MERNLLAKMRAQISFSADGSALLKLAGPPSSLTMILTLRREEWNLYSSPPGEGTIPPELETEYSVVWAKKNPLGLAKHYAPILIYLKPGTQTVKL